MDVEHFGRGERESEKSSFWSVDVCGVGGVCGERVVGHWGS